jgi:hypothetical protein
VDGCVNVIVATPESMPVTVVVPDTAVPTDTMPLLLVLPAVATKTAFAQTTKLPELELITPGPAFTVTTMVAVQPADDL